jgi:hypothetical protein
VPPPPTYAKASVGKELRKATEALAKAAVRTGEDKYKFIENLNRTNFKLADGLN